MIGAGVAQALKDAAYAVDWVADGDVAVDAAEAAAYDLVLLDLGLPSRDGLAILSQLHKHQRDLPVIILTARDGIDERVDGLDLGADDYLTKPFDTRELLARIRAILRRPGGTASPLLSNGYVHLDPSTREATTNDKTCRLTAREFALLHALLTRPGTILSRDELEHRIYGWNEEVDSFTRFARSLAIALFGTYGASAGWSIAHRNEVLAHTLAFRTRRIDRRERRGCGRMGFPLVVR
jgi:two-component system OmpR family response regulator